MTVHNSRQEAKPFCRIAVIAMRSVLALAVSAAAASCGSKTSSSKPGVGSAADPAPAEFGLPLAKLAARIEETEKLIAQCMSTAGFTYVALDFVSVKKAMDSDQSAAGVASEEYVKRFGLGITTQFDKPLVMFGAGPTNNAYLASLPASDQVAFRRELWGEAVDWNHARAIEAEDLSSTGGCTRKAAEKTYAADELTSSYVNPGDKRVDQDPRMTAARKKWSDCMRTAGFTYDRPDQVDADLRGRLDAIAQGQDPRKLAGASLDALHALQGEELSIALVLTKCEETHIEPVRVKIESEIYGAPVV
jgi:hypothetical protein